MTWMGHTLSFSRLGFACPARHLCNCPILRHCTKARTIALWLLSHGNSSVFSHGAIGTSIANPVSVNDDCRPSDCRGQCWPWRWDQAASREALRAVIGTLPSKARASLVPQSGVTASFRAGSHGRRGICRARGRRNFHWIGARLRSIRGASTLSRKGEL
jgi:hypothetical protein